MDMEQWQDSRKATLGFLTYAPAYVHNGGVYIHVGTGRVVEALSPRYEKVLLCAPVVHGPPTAPTDLRLAADNVELIAQPYYNSVVGALKRGRPILRAYRELCRRAKLIFLRGLLPALGAFYLIAWRHGCRVCQWVIGNPVALLQAHRRKGRVLDTLALAYAWQDRLACRIGRRLTDGAFVCNGRELGAIYRSPRTLVTVSSVITAREFYEREDTCTRDPVRILFLGYIRPEKGVEYLFEAVTRLRTERKWELVIVGPWDKFEAYREELVRIVEHAGLAERVCWRGYVSYGEPLLAEMRAADVFVLPTLSEGTPRTLVEARANSLPLVATNVGGIPTSVQHEHDGLLVAPRDAVALAGAIDRLIEDGALRRRLIVNGRATARELTIDRFADQVYEVLEELRCASRA
jgi:glycosyltransferase involved in cell wall biosynthesis